MRSITGNISHVFTLQSIADEVITHGEHCKSRSLLSQHMIISGTQNFWTGKLCSNLWVF
jgi:hypothetical protein